MFLFCRMITMLPRLSPSLSPSCFLQKSRSVRSNPGRVELTFDMPANPCHNHTPCTHISCHILTLVYLSSFFFFSCLIPDLQLFPYLVLLPCLHDLAGVAHYYYRCILKLHSVCHIYQYPIVRLAIFFSLFIDEMGIVCQFLCPLCYGTLINSYYRIPLYSSFPYQLLFLVR